MVPDNADPNDGWLMIDTSTESIQAETEPQVNPEMAAIPMGNTKPKTTGVGPKL
jgi:hypothetical protein